MSSPRRRALSFARVKLRKKRGSGLVVGLGFGLGLGLVVGRKVSAPVPVPAPVSIPSRAGTVVEGICGVSVVDVVMGRYPNVMSGAGAVDWFSFDLFIGALKGSFDIVMVVRVLGFGTARGAHGFPIRKSCVNGRVGMASGVEGTTGMPFGTWRLLGLGRVRSVWLCVSDGMAIVGTTGGISVDCVPVGSM